MACERVDAGQIAEALGINRATLYRWFGGRDALLIETLWSLCQDEMQKAERAAKGKGIEWMIDGLRLFVGAIAQHSAYQHFLRAEPEAAARALFTDADSVRHRIVQVAADYARRYGGFLARHLDPEPLAMAVVRVGEAFLYGDHLGNGAPNVADLIKIYRLILRPL
jgi:AcrR family transcriptional regulator